MRREGEVGQGFSPDRAERDKGRKAWVAEREIRAPEGRHSLKSGAQFVIVWEFRVKPQAEAEFVRHYGPDGSWAQFFRGSKGYIRTELVRDVADRLRFLTLDHWESEEEFTRFREQNLAGYERLDRKFDGLTEQERRLGAFWIGTVRGASGHGKGKI